MYILRMASLESNSKLCNFVKNDQNTTKSCRRFFLHQTNKIQKKNRDKVLALVLLCQFEQYKGLKTFTNLLQKKLLMTILFIPFDFRFLYKSVFWLPILEIPFYGFSVSGSVFPILSITPAAIYYLVEEMDERNLCLKGNFSNVSTLSS